MSDGTDGSRRPDPLDIEWAAPSRRGRAIAATLAVLLAALTALLVSLAWRRISPPPRVGPVEVKLLASPAAVVPAPARTAASAPP